MKTVTFTDEEVQELREILNSKISHYLDEFYEMTPDGAHHEFNPKAEVFMSIYNKIVTRVFPGYDS